MPDTKMPSNNMPDKNISAAALAPYRVSAYNTAHDSENKIHDDETARRFGFGGGLVPGVDVYGYMTHLPVLRWGRAWLERGTADCRFLKPLYDGDIASVTAAENDGALEITVESRGTVCATGRASLPQAGPVPSIESSRQVPQRAEARSRPLSGHPGDGGAVSCRLPRNRRDLPRGGAGASARHPAEL